MNAGFPADIARALDQFDVPAPGPGFVDRLTAIADGPADALPPYRPRFRAVARRRWLTRGAVAALALGLASATAAASGVFHAIGIDMPAIARFVAPAPTPAKLAMTPPRHHAARAVAVAVPKAVPVAAPPPPLALAPTRDERRARFQALPMPVRAVMIERRAARIQRRLAWQGIDAPRDAIRARLAEQLGQTDLPTGPGPERRAQIRAAVLAAPPGTLPPRLERLRARLTARATLEDDALPRVGRAARIEPATAQFDQ